jgi:hypothetical protein
VRGDRERIDWVGERFDFPDDAFDRMVLHRDRKRRHERLAAGTVACLVTVAVVGMLVLGWVSSEGGLPVAITADNVGTLQQVWWAELDGPTSARVAERGSLVYPPVATGDRVYVGTEAGTVYAFPSSCETDCQPVWTGHADGPIERSVTVSGGTVFAATRPGSLYAFPEDCIETCAPRWVGDVGGRLGSSPVVADGRVFGVDVDSGTLYAFPEDCTPNAQGVCQPAWRATYFEPDPFDRYSLPAEGELTPTVANGQVFALAQNGNVGDLYTFDSDTGAVQWRSQIGGGSGYMARPVTSGGRVFAKIGPSGLYAFQQRCGAGGATCDPDWTSGRDPFWQPRADPNDRFLGPIVADDGLVFATCCFTSSGHVFAFEANGDGTPVWEGTYEGGGAWNYPIAAEGVVYVAGDGSEIGPQDGSLSAFAEECTPSGGICEPLWRANTEGLEHADPFTPTTPVVTNGIVFIGSTGGDVAAYVRCEASTCAPTWHWAAADVGDALSTPAVGSGAVFVAQESGRLIAFAPGSNT